MVWGRQSVSCGVLAKKNHRQNIKDIHDVHAVFATIAGGEVVAPVNGRIIEFQLNDADGDIVGSR